jgi:glycosyltransferase involved in cell wall biosynthesis
MKQELVRSRGSYKISVVIENVGDQMAFGSYAVPMLSRLTRQHRVRLYCQSSKGLVLQGLEVIELPVRVKKPLWLNKCLFLAQVERELEKDDHDVLYSHEYGRQPGVYVMQAGCHKTKALGRGRIGRWLNALQGRLNIGRSIERRKEDSQFSQRKADVLIVHSQYLKRNLALCYPEYDSTVVVVPPGVDTKGAPKACYSGDEEMEVLFVGMDFERKGLEQALRGFAASQLRRAKLIVAGDIPKTRFKKLCRELKIESRVEFMGFVRDMSQLYARVHVLLSPALDSGFGRSVLEAMSVGLPVITSPSSCCGLAEQLAPGEAVILQNPYNTQSIAIALENLSEAGVWARFSRHSLSVAERLSWDLCAEKTLEALDLHFSLCGGKRP